MTKNVDAVGSRARRPLFRMLAVAWLATAAAMVIFSWTLAGGYARYALTSDSRDDQRAIAMCRTARCDPDPAGLLAQQWSALGHARTVVWLSAWSITGLAALILLVATVHAFDRLHVDAARFLGVAWKVQAGVAIVLLAAQILVLLAGARVMAGIPDEARTVAAAVSFETPLTGFGNLYYFGWFAAVAVIGTVLTVSLRDVVVRTAPPLPSRR
jgi:hypothetical protein